MWLIQSYVVDIPHLGSSHHIQASIHIVQHGSLQCRWHSNHRSGTGMHFGSFPGDRFADRRIPHALCTGPRLELWKESMHLSILLLYQGGPNSYPTLLAVTVTDCNKASRTGAGNSPAAIIGLSKGALQVPLTWVPCLA